MKKTLIFLVALCSCICASAQKPVVVVDHFTSTTCKAGDLENLRNQVITGIYETGSVTLVDIEAESTMTMEAERRSSELSLADETARIGIMKTLGANYVLTGTASKLSADKKSADHYTGNVVFTLKVVNAENGTIIGAETYQYSDLSAGSGASADGALYETLAKVKNAMASFVSKYFKPKGAIVEIGDLKNGKPKTCYISLGASSGVKEGDTFIVHETKMVAATEVQEAVGKVKVETVLADGLSRCKISSGSEMILSAFQAGHELLVEGEEKRQAKHSAEEVGRGVVEAGKKAVDIGEKAVRVGEGISRIIKIFK